MALQKEEPLYVNFLQAIAVTTERAATRCHDAVTRSGDVEWCAKWFRTVLLTREKPGDNSYHLITLSGPNSNWFICPSFSTKNTFYLILLSRNRAKLKENEQLLW